MKHPDRGAAVVEMAITMLFLIPLLVGLIDVGRLVYSHIAVQEAAQEGAMLASFTESVTQNEIRSRVIDSTSFPPILDSEIAITCHPDPRAEINGSVVTVTVTHDFDLLLPFSSSATIAKTAATDRFFASCP